MRVILILREVFYRMQSRPTLTGNRTDGQQNILRVKQMLNPI